MNKPAHRTSATSRSSSASSKRYVLSLVLVIVLAAGGLLFADWWSVHPAAATATYVGRQSCAQCHSQQATAWEGSHHDLAMDLATPETVLGDFGDVEFTHHDVTSRLYRRDGKYMVYTEGPDGNMQDFEIKYVFGVEPLQQYMVEFDRPADLPAEKVGRVQVLRISWDTQRQEWFYLPPPDVDEKLEPDDDLHWTGIAQRWNNMCADCHSTNLQKNFDPLTRRYHTTFSEIDVSCEACHGPGSLHVELATAKSLFWDRKHGYGLAKLKDKSSHAEIQACAPCHSRRRVVYPEYHAGHDYYDYFANELLQEHTYHADGQIMDEVYVYGSYLQSKMHKNGIRCSDCHDPHSTRLKHEGNRVCTSCHQHPAGKYDTPAHHRHDMGSKGAQCVECHMPSTTYMEVDPRRDHSLRVPRPDLSVAAGTPNACSGCHLERAPLNAERRAELSEYSDWLLAAREGDAEVHEALRQVDRWAAEHFESWYGRKTDLQGHFAKAVQSARGGEPAAERLLIDIARDPRNSGIVRATSLVELARVATDQTQEASARLLKDPDPQVRWAALTNLQFLPDQQLAELVTPLLDDETRVVRTEAARILARLPRQQLRGPQRKKLSKALGEFQAGIMVNNDRATAHMSIGILFESLRDLTSARRAYETALHVEPNVTGPRTNLAAVLDELARQAQQRVSQLMLSDRQQAQKELEQVMEYSRKARRLRREELDLLARDAALAPHNAPIKYRYGLSLYLHDRLEEAEEALRAAVELDPHTPDFALALALFYQKQERFEEALHYGNKLLTLRPDDATYRQLVAELKSQAAGRPRGS